MELTQKQTDIVLEFFKKKLPGQSLISISSIEAKGKKFLGINLIEAAFIAQKIFKTIFAENPEISFEEFENKISNRIKKLHELSEEHEKSFEKLGKFVSRQRGKLTSVYAIDVVTKYFENIGLTGLPFEQQVKSFRLYAKFLPQWIKTEPRKIGRFIAVHDIHQHIETPLCLTIRLHGGKRIATIGGYIYFEKNRPAIRITNIQGIQKILGVATEKDRQEIEELNRTLGENWRIFFAKEIASIAEKKGITLFGEIPQKFGLLAGISGEKEYKRQKRQYKQTYRKAGFTQQPDGSWKFAPQNPREHRNKKTPLFPHYH